MIYLDNAATTKIDGRVLDAMMPYLKDEYGNAGTLYGLGRRAKNAIDKSRTQVAGFLHCDPEQIIFTSGGTEGNNLVIRGVAPYLQTIGKTRIITSSVEHDSVIHAVETLYIKDGFHIDYLPVNSKGVVLTDNLNIPNNVTGLVSIMYVNNETGSVNPVYEIANECHKQGVLFHTDCVQAAGVQEVFMDELACDFATISSHKIHGPKGMGAVFARDKSLLSPLICGGHSQESGYRGGTENVAGIVGFGMACEIAEHEIAQNIVAVTRAKTAFYDSLMNALMDSGSGGNDPMIRVNGMPVPSPGKTLNLTIKGVDGETLVLMLDAMGVCISAGSACRSHEEKPSRVLTAMGLSDEEARCSVRISFSANESEDEVSRAASVMADCINVLRGKV